MAAPQKSSKKELSFTERELMVMVQEIVLVEPKIFGALISQTTESEKNVIWARILSRVNAVSQTTRTVDKIKRRWHELKARVKKLYSDHRADTQRTGGGSPPPPLQLLPWEEMVLSIIPQEGLHGVGGIDSARDTRPTSHSPVPLDEEETLVIDLEDTADDQAGRYLLHGPLSPGTFETLPTLSTDSTSAPESISSTEYDTNTQVADKVVVPAAGVTENPRAQSRVNRDRQTVQREEAQPLEDNGERDDEAMQQQFLMSYDQSQEGRDQLLQEVKGIRQGQQALITRMDTMNDYLAQKSYSMGQIVDVLREIKQTLGKSQAPVTTPSQTSAGPPGDSQTVPIPAPVSDPTPIIRKSSRKKRNQESDDVDLPTTSKRSRN